MRELICLNHPPTTTFPEGQPFDMTDLMQKLIEKGQRVIGFPITEYWLDVGRHEDYQPEMFAAENSPALIAPVEHRLHELMV